MPQISSRARGFHFMGCILHTVCTPCMMPNHKQYIAKQFRYTVWLSPILLHP